LDKTKSDFITIASHELRTPLTILRGYSQMLLKEPIIQESEFLEELLTSIQHGAERLHEIVNSLLDVAKIDSRSLDLYPEPLYIAPLIHEVYQKYKGAVTERKLTFRFQDLEALPGIEADPEALSKAIDHLITNAIKYTPDGGKITVSGQIIGDPTDADTARIELIVSDTGIGIEPDFHDLIFTKFYQTGEVALHSTGQTKFRGGGPGLGLAVARGIVEAHQGKLWVESAGYDEVKLPGSRFHLVLPLRQEDEPTWSEAVPDAQDDQVRSMSSVTDQSQ
jgi:signal transduction histidine kinase